VFSRDKLVDGDLSGALPQCLYVRDRSVDFGLPQMRFGNDSRYRATMSGDDYSLPTLDVIEKLGKVSLGLRGLNFAHGGSPNSLVDSTGRFVRRRRRIVKGAGFQDVQPIRSLASLPKGVLSTDEASWWAGVGIHPLPIALELWRRSRLTYSLDATGSEPLSDAIPPPAANGIEFIGTPEDGPGIRVRTRRSEK
jgi:hypothetical protein